MTSTAGQVLLLQPWVEDFYATDCRIQPIGLAYLAGALQEAFPELDVQIFDTLAGGRKRSIPWPKEFEYLTPYYGTEDSGPFALFHKFYRFGCSDDEIRERLRDYQPELIGISSLFTPYYRQSLALARLCRRAFPGVHIVMGGNHASLHPQTLLVEGGADYVLRGEAEESIVELMRALRGEVAMGGVPNLVAPHGTPVEHPSPVAPNRQALPLPRFNGLEPDAYRYNRRRMTFLITSRSCPHRCTFCSIHAVFGTRYEIRPTLEVVSEIEKRFSEGVRHFDIEDDNFTFRKGDTLDLLKAIAALKLPITLSAMNGISYLSLDDELLLSMKAAGFESLNLSLVSSDELVLRFTKRPHTLERFSTVVAAANGLGFDVTAYFILGMPGQSVPEMCGTLKALAAAQTLVGASPFYFTPGSPIHERESNNSSLRLASEGRDPYFSARLTAMDLEGPDFSRGDVYTCFRMTRALNHAKMGLDRGCGEGDAWFAPLERALARGTWSTKSKRASVSLPFSSDVHELLCRESWLIAGYKTPRQLRWDPERRAFVSPGRGSEGKTDAPHGFVYADPGTAIRSMPSTSSGSS